MNKRHSADDLARIRQQAFVFERSSPELARHVTDLCDQLMEEGPVEIKLTEEEKNLLNMTADIWNKYLELPVQKKDDGVDFCRSIHELQRIICSRPFMRDGSIHL